MVGGRGCPSRRAGGFAEPCAYCAIGQQYRCVCEAAHVAGACAGRAIMRQSRWLAQLQQPVASPLCNAWLWKQEGAAGWFSADSL